MIYMDFDNQNLYLHADLKYIFIKVNKSLISFIYRYISNLY